VLCMGVIEHIPSSPRPLLDTLNRVLRPGGLLVIDTPNLVHLYNRQKFARGETVLADIQAQYETALPFEGHHREYTIEELVWLLRRIGHHGISVEAFNYSSYALGTLVARDVHNHWNMVRDPTMREYLMTVSVKPADGAAPDPDARDWRALIDDPERSWLRALPAVMQDQPPFDADRELHLVRMQHEINVRDAERAALQQEVNLRDDMLRDVHDRMVREVQRRDEIIDGLRREQDWMRRGWRRFIIGRPPHTRGTT
jgi:SAM-dependent methyltransferase